MVGSRCKGLLILALCLAIGWGCRDYGLFALPVVGLIEGSVEVEACHQTYQGVVDGLKEAGYHDRFSVKLRKIEVAAQPERARKAARELVQAGARVLVCLGTMATLAALEATHDQDIPIVYIIMGAPEAIGLGRGEKAEGVRFTGTSMEIPAVEQLQMLRWALPGIKKLGIFYSLESPLARASGEEMEVAAELLGLAPESHAVSQERLPELAAEVAALLTRQVEAVVIPTDPVLCMPQNLMTICRETSKTRVPVQVVADAMLVYGALLAYHGDYYDIGRQAGRQAGRILAGVPPGRVPPERPRLRKLTVNLKAAHELGLELERSFLSLASHLVQ